MTLYATGIRNAELTRLKSSDIDSKWMVIHIQCGNGRQDRDVMLSPRLLEELRAHWRRLRKKSTWCSCNRWHSGDRPMDTKTLGIGNSLRDGVRCRTSPEDDKVTVSGAMAEKN